MVRGTKRQHVQQGHRTFETAVLRRPSSCRAPVIQPSSTRPQLTRTTGRDRTRLVPHPLTSPKRCLIVFYNKFYVAFFETLLKLLPILYISYCLTVSFYTHLLNKYKPITIINYGLKGIIILERRYHR